MLPSEGRRGRRVGKAGTFLRSRESYGRDTAATTAWPPPSLACQSLSEHQLRARSNMEEHQKLLVSHKTVFGRALD